MIFEMTLDYTVIIPMTITVALSYGVRTDPAAGEHLHAEAGPARATISPTRSRPIFYHLRKTRDVMDTHFVALPGSGTVADFVRTAGQRADVCCFLVEGPQGPIGFLPREVALRPQDTQSDKTLADLADRNFVTVNQEMPLSDVLARMRHAHSSVALVAGGNGKLQGREIQGVITDRQIANVAIDGMELFST